MFISGAHLRALPFSARLRVGPLAWRFVPDSPVVDWAGQADTAAGCAFAIWARMLLGGNWSASVTVKHDHQLIRQGPYSIVRHPICSGLLLALLGTALALGELRGIVDLALALAGWHT
jgi:protein-S-isoprenylcysteine O-methyltransferase Ste14